MRIIIAITLAFLLHSASAQFPGIHQQQQSAWAAYGELTDHQYDSLNHFAGRMKQMHRNAPLQKRVFGYHPYWSGSTWQNYQWSLLSDLCFFSYEVDPATGNATTTHDWETAPVIDTALAHGVKVHLCVTLFSGHATFFANPSARQTLINNIINMLVSRGAQGVNLDFEAVPSLQQSALTSCIIEISEALHTALPDAELSIAAPAVNWNNTFDMPALAPWLDLVMVMAYDYYWNGSTLAGPVAGMWPMVSTFEYGVNQSLSWYQSQGIDPGKILLGQPYYGREWPVSSNALPSGTTGSGTALTYRVIRQNNSGYYSPENAYWDGYSYNPYFSYFSAQWRQCFWDDSRSLGAKYDLVNRRNVGGIGIWALGYDNGFMDLWELIAEKFTIPPADACCDTLHDSGGPWFKYGNREAYTETIQSAWEGPLSLEFLSFDLEPGYDSLWIFDGGSTQSPLLAALSGDEIPAALQTSGSTFTLQFYSDGWTTRAGYDLRYACPTVGLSEVPSFHPGFNVFPQPAVNEVYILMNDGQPTEGRILVRDMMGRIVLQSLMNDKLTRLPLQGLAAGTYLLSLRTSDWLETRKLVVGR